MFSERFAIDFVRLDGEAIATGDPAANRSYRGYGEDVYAVADARVAAVVDGMVDNVPANRAPAGLTLADMGGNLVVLELKSGHYVFYAHLQPGSIRVRENQQVRVGQLLGRLGNSGNSNAPHLHFQVSDGPSLLLSNSVPFVFDAFDYQGQMRRDEIPLENWIVSFSR